MKQITVALAILIALFFINISFSLAQSVSAVEAETVAKNFMKTQSPQAKLIQSAPKTVSAENSSETLIHVFNFDPEGFVLVSGDKKSIPILGFSNEGGFDTEHLNPEAAYYVNELKEQLVQLKTEKNLPSLVAQWNPLLTDRESVSAESSETIGPLLTTKWNQDTYYNEQCPIDNAGPNGHALAGCVAVAMAQVIKFHDSPVIGIGSHQYVHPDYGLLSGYFGAYEFKWNNMPDMLLDYNLDVARLIFYCGVAVEMDYGPDESGANTSAIAPALQNYFKFSNSIQWISAFMNGSNFTYQLMDELYNGRPVLMRGCYGLFGGGCHAWVCHGYKIVPNISGVFFEMNWGWGGQHDGYFVLDDLSPGSQYYNWHVNALIGIEPSCPRNLEITTAPLAGVPEIEAIESITTSVPAVPFIPSLGKKIRYDAGRFIQMNPGFIADGHEVSFQADIQGCGGLSPFLLYEPDDRTNEDQNVIQDTTLPGINIHPNPFSGSTTFTIDLIEDQVLDVRIFDAYGSLVAQPLNQEMHCAGKHTLNFEAVGLKPGMYFVVAELNAQQVCKRMVLMQ